MTIDPQRERTMAVAERLRNELNTYEQHKAELVAQGEGKWALIQDGQVSGIWDTYEDALKAGYSEFGLTPFLVKRIEVIERVFHLNRDSPAA